MQFVDLERQRERLSGRIEAAISRVVADGRYIHGPDVAAFEAQLADYVGVGHAIGCANGTDALLLPLMALGVGPGDAVFVPSFTFAATAEVVALARAEPVFVDVDPETYNLDPNSLRAAIAAVEAAGRLSPRAVMPVDLFGLAADYEAIGAIAAEHDMIVIEDAAQSMGGTLHGRKCGSFGDIAGTSFYPAKPLGCYGDGGAILTDDGDLAELMRSLAFHGKGEGQYDNVRVGINSRLDTLQAAILIEKLAILEEEMEARQAVARRYVDALAGRVRTPAVDNTRRSAWAQFAIELEDRDGLKERLAGRGIPSMIYYPRPLHLQPAYRSYADASLPLPHAEAICGRILCLPMHPYLDMAEQDRVIDAVLDHV